MQSLVLKFFYFVGFIGKSVRSLSGGTLARVTGLDPAGPSFVLATSGNRLADNDAVNVDTIVTDSGLSGLGLDRSLGQVNFWPNGGTASQPGCFVGKYFIEEYLRLIIEFFFSCLQPQSCLSILCRRNIE